VAEKISSYSDYKVPGPEPDASSPTWGDYGRNLVGSTLGLGADISSVGEAAGEYGQGNDLGSQDSFLKGVGAAGHWLRETLSAGSDHVLDGMSPEGHKRLAAAVTSPEFWQHPISSTLLKATGQLPQLALSVIPAGLAVKASQAAALVATTSGAVNMAQGTREFYELVDKASDDELRSSPFYAALRDQGMSEESARARLATRLRGNTSLVNFMVGSLGAAIGPEAMVARAMKGSARGRLGQAAEGLIGGTAGEALESGVQEFGKQKQATDEGLQSDIDKDALVNAVAEGGLLGGVIGGVAGVATGKGHAKPKSKKPEIQPESESAAQPENKITDTTKDPAAVGPPEKSFSASAVANPPPVTDVEVGDKHNPTATRSATEYPKDTKSEAPAAPKGADAKDISKKRSAKATKAAENITPVVVTPEVAEALQAESAAPTTPPEHIMADAVQQARQAAQQQPQAPVQPVTPQVTDQATQQAAPEMAPQPEQTVAQPPVANPTLPEVPGTPENRTSGLPTASPIEPSPVQPASAPEAPQVKKPRILQDLTVPEMPDKTTIKANLRQMEKEEAGPQAGHRSEKELRQFGQHPEQAEAAKQLFDEQPARTFPNTLEERTKLRTELENLLNKAEEAGIKIPAKITDNLSDHVAWLREVKDLYNAMGKKSFVGAKATEGITRFLTREQALREGDSKSVRAERRAEGEAAKRRNQGDVETMGANDGTKQVAVVGSESTVGRRRSRECPPAPRRLRSRPKKGAQRP
jgi:hypothetical protein